MDPSNVIKKYERHGSILKNPKSVSLCASPYRCRGCLITWTGFGSVQGLARRPRTAPGTLLSTEAVLQPHRPQPWAPSRAHNHPSRPFKPPKWEAASLQLQQLKAFSRKGGSESVLWVSRRGSWEEIGARERHEGWKVGREARMRSLPGTQGRT